MLQFSALITTEHRYMPWFFYCPLPALRLEQFKKDMGIFCLRHQKGQEWRLKGCGGQKHSLGHHVLKLLDGLDEKIFWNLARKRRPICYFRV